ncbi:MAG: RDD family protein [Byssovorax sp.]
MANFNDPNGDFNPYAPPAAVADTSSFDDEDVLIPAERGTRWWARFVDQLLWAATAIPFAVVFYGTKEPFGAALGVLCLAFIIYQWYLVSTTGQTIAKKWMGIKVVKMDGSPCGFVHGVLLRELILLGAGLIPFVGKLVGLVDSLMIFGEARRCMHDHIAGTKVVLALRTR